jgi:predicted TIM-barrel fold metal-dependent hydrolase
MANAALLSSVRVFDTDSHVSEPYDLWTSRVPSRFRDQVPVVETWKETGSKHWRIGKTWLAATGFFAQAGVAEYPPAGNYRNLEDADPGSWNPVERLKRMDEHGVYAQVLYPNIIGFEAPLIMDLGPELSIVCTEVYNDFLTEFASTDPRRFIPIAMVPFWDIEASLKEIQRAYDMGHKGVLFANKFEQIGFPQFTDPHWDPIYDMCQALELSINFHVGFAGMREGVHTGKAKLEAEKSFDPRQSARRTSVGIMSNADTIANVIASGLADRFPRLPFVSVESGMGYIPYLLNSMDWHWEGYGAHVEHPTLPSEIFRRQCYGTFWFETDTLCMLEKYPDNFMFETDYPHPTAMAPGPNSPARRPADHILSAFADVPDDVARKALQDNAARIYHME